jgi:predicted nucleic acid-binding protein
VGSRLRCVIDASVIIDLHNGGILKRLVDLPFDLVMPDIVLAEHQSPSFDEVLSLGICVEELSGTLVQQVAELASQNRKLSMQDLFAFVLARHHGCSLVTGDGRLRRLAEQQAIECHGTLRVMDEMIEYGILTPASAGTALKMILVNDARLPAAECEERQRAWGRWQGNHMTTNQE